MLNDYRREKPHLEKAAGFILETGACSLWAGAERKGPVFWEGKLVIVWKVQGTLSLSLDLNCQMGTVTPVLPTLHNVEEWIKCKGKL